MPPSPAGSDPRIAELDVLRGVAALAVLLSHYTAMYDYHHGLSSRLGFELKAGSYGVLLFFVISGFVIMMTLDKCRTGADFVVSRASRIFPAYWVGVLLTFASLRLFHAEPPGFAVLAANLTMFQRFIGFPHLDSVYWTLNVEFAFYAWMLLLYRLNALKRFHAVIVGALTIQLAASLYQRLSGIHFGQGVQVVFLLEYVNLFSAGILFYHASRKGFSAPTVALLGWCLVNHGFTPFRSFPWIPRAEWGVVAVAGTFLIFTLVLKRRLRWIVSGPTLFFGTISYPLYLLHNEIGKGLLETLSARGASYGEAFWIALGVSILLAAALTFWVERPALRRIRSRYSGWKNHGAPSVQRR
jgi:peptidoglycan/LPS O-acetylase OafA/YrhL